MKHHKRILYHAFIPRKYEELKVRKIVIFQNFKIYVAMQNGCYGDFAPVLEFRTQMSNVETQESNVREMIHYNVDFCHNFNGRG